MELKITKPGIYNMKVVDVDASGLKTGLKGSFNGTIEVVINESDDNDVSKEQRFIITGQHGPRDYEEDFGFIIVNS